MLTRFLRGRLWTSAPSVIGTWPLLEARARKIAWLVELLILLLTSSSLAWSSRNLWVIFRYGLSCSSRISCSTTSISPSVRRSFVGKREFLRMSPPSHDLSTLFARSVIDFAPPNPSRLIPFSEPSGDLVSIFLILLGGPSRSSPGLLPQSS